MGTYGDWFEPERVRNILLQSGSETDRELFLLKIIISEITLDIMFIE